MDGKRSFSLALSQLAAALICRSFLSAKAKRRGCGRRSSALSPHTLHRTKSTPVRTWLAA